MRSARVKGVRFGYSFTMAPDIYNAKLAKCQCSLAGASSGQVLVEFGRLDAADSGAFDSTSAPTMPKADPVGEHAMPEGLLHKACWTFISSCRVAFGLSNHVA